MPANSKPANRRAVPLRGTATVFSILFMAGAVSCSSASKETAETTATSAGEPAETLHLETFVLNLADPGQRAYLRVGIDLGLSRPMGKSEHALQLGPIRDAIIGVLGQGKADDLSTPKGKEQLKQDLLHTLQEKVPSLGVRDVYFTEFLIQR